MKLVLIGDGDQRAEYEKLAHDLGIEFAGQQDGIAARQAMSESKYVVSPSECWETFGLSAAEALSTGTPVIVSDCGALPDLVKDTSHHHSSSFILNSSSSHCGEIFEAGNAEALAQAIERLLKRNDYAEMCAHAKERAESRYTEEANYSRLQEIYGDAKRVLLVHNFYGSSAPSGENKVFEAEKRMLESRGIIVSTYTRHSDEIRNGSIVGLLKGALSTIANPFSARALAKKCRDFKPDIIHFHNTFPLISPLAIRAASKFAPVILTLHNYRTVCAAGIPMRDGRVCRDCFKCEVSNPNISAQVSLSSRNDAVKGSTGGADSRTRGYQRDRCDFDPPMVTGACYARASKSCRGRPLITIRASCRDAGSERL